MNKYQVVPNRCGCHPETCCCNDYAVVDEKGNKYTTCFREAEAEDIARLLNAKTDLAVQPDYKALYQAEQKLRMEAEACADMLRGSRQNAEKVDVRPFGYTLGSVEKGQPHGITWFYSAECKSNAERQVADSRGKSYLIPLYAARPDQAMAPQDWIDRMAHMMVDLCMDDDAAAEIMAHARKRVQPASGEDAK